MRTLFTPAIFAAASSIFCAQLAQSRSRILNAFFMGIVSFIQGSSDKCCTNLTGFILSVTSKNI